MGGDSQSPLQRVFCKAIWDFLKPKSDGLCEAATQRRIEEPLGVLQSNYAKVASYMSIQMDFAKPLGTSQSAYIEGQSH